jgi:uncharacterized protein (TIGR03437 family)
MTLSKALLLCFVSVLAVSDAVGQAPLNGSHPPRVIGQPSVDFILSSQNPNVVQGRELWAPSGVALDTSLTPPAVYVADTANNRILGWRNAASFQNGAYADLVLGQNSVISTLSLGPGTSITHGLTQPTGLAVDKQSNLWVVDSGNNRIVRFPQPFAAGGPQTSDVVIGQADFNSRTANRGGSVAANTVSTPVFVDGHPAVQSLAFDANGNLWFTDTGNHRVLRYPAASLTSQPTPNVVLGQPNLTTATPAPATAQGAESLSSLRYPTGVALDQLGRIFVTDGLARALVYGANPAQVGTSALRLLGRVRLTQGQMPPPRPNNIEFALALSVTTMANRPAVMDYGNNRIMVFDPFDSWAPDNPSTPGATSVIGQPNFSTNTPSAANNGLASPRAAAFSGTELFVADGAGNRMVVFPQNSTVATRVLGQVDFGYSAPNLIEGREMYLFSGFYGLNNVSGVNFTDGGGIAIDASSGTVHLYVADTYNNRILCYRDVRNVRPGDKADMVIGQQDLLSSQINAPLNSSTQWNDQGLYLPIGLTVDPNGNLYVADFGNSRVLRFHQPFNGQNFPHADLVLGQRSFTTQNTDPSAGTMAAPFGVALMPEGHLLVSDRSHNRVLIFKKPTGGDFTSGQDAGAVIGQPNFFAITSAQGLPNRLVSPRGITIDSSGRLFVADTGNNRILVYTEVGSIPPGSDPSPVFSITNSTPNNALRAPVGVSVNPSTGEIWVAESGSGGTGHVFRYPEYSHLLATGLPDYGFTSPTAPLAVVLDPSANLLVAEAGNRVSYYFKPVWVTNSGNYLPDANKQSTWDHPCCAPGQIATAWAFSPSLSYGNITEAHFTSVPIATTLGDVQVFVNGVASPVYDVIPPNQINFQLPQATPTGSAIDVIVSRASTGEILGYNTATVVTASPGLITNSLPTGLAGAIQVSAQQFADNPVTCNGLANTTNTDTVHCPGGIRPANRGETITLYLTGQGVVSGMPADGDQAPAGSKITTSTLPRVIIGSDFVPDGNVTYSGLAPTLVGVWQINVVIPDKVAPGTTPVAVVYKDVASSDSGYPATVIQVK